MVEMRETEHALDRLPSQWDSPWLPVLGCSPSLLVLRATSIPYALLVEKLISTFLPPQN